MILSTWKVAMVCLLPLLAVGSPKRICGIAIPWGQRGRTWSVMIGASMIAMLFESAAIWPFMAIDAVAAAIVLKRPRGEYQRAIGLLFVSMMFLHVGFYLACRMQPGPHDFVGYAEWNRLLGWMQWACLLSWGIRDAFRRLHGRSGDSGNPVASGAGIR